MILSANQCKSGLSPVQVRGGREMRREKENGEMREVKNK